MLRDSSLKKESSVPIRGGSSADTVSIIDKCHRLNNFSFVPLKRHHVKHNFISQHFLDPFSNFFIIKLQTVKIFKQLELARYQEVLNKHFDLFSCKFALLNFNSLYLCILNFSSNFLKPSLESTLSNSDLRLLSNYSHHTVEVLIFFKKNILNHS